MILLSLTGSCWAKKESGVFPPALTMRCLFLQVSCRTVTDIQLFELEQHVIRKDGRLGGGGGGGESGGGLS